MKKKQMVAGVLASALMLGAGSASAVVIDNFTGDTYSADAPLTGASAGTSSAGYTRTVDATTSGVSTTIQINTLTNTALYAHSQESGVTGTSQLNFDLGGLDLTGGGTLNAFRIGLNSIDLDGWFGIIVDSIKVELSSNSVLIDNGLATPSYADILFSDFGLADLANASTLSLFVDSKTTAALDASFFMLETVCSGLASSGGSGVNGTNGNCNISTVPEPGTLVLLGLGLAGMARIGRKKLTA